MIRLLRSCPTLALLVLLLAPAAGAADRDADYDAILDAYKAKRWVDVERLAPAFVKAKPDYAHTHSVRYMRASALRNRNLLPEAEAAYREYVRVHADGKYADRCRVAVIQVLNADVRHAEALTEADAYLKTWPKGASAPQVRYDRGLALEGLRRFDEAAAEYRAVTGKIAEAAAFRVGVAFFRGRKFTDARAALESFRKLYPTSKLGESAEDYLFRCDTGFEDVRDGIVRDYRGKYEKDGRLEAVRAGLAKRREAALRRIEKILGERVPRTFLLRFADAGDDRSGHFARTRLEVVKGEPRHVVILYTEYLVLGAIDLDATLTHELYHCVQRERLGEDHFITPKWVREGTALYVAGQGESRSRFLAAEVGRRAKLPDPMRVLVNGLAGRHVFEDYAESVAAFEAAEKRHGRAKTVRLLRRLLETTDAAAAIRETLGEDMPTFEAGAADLARARLGPMVAGGRDALLAALVRAGKRNWEGMLATLPADSGAYEPLVVYYRAYALHEMGRNEEALRTIREDFLAKHRHHATFVDNAVLVELKILRALGSDEFAAAADRAVRDLEPTGSFAALEKFLGGLPARDDEADDAVDDGEDD